MAEYETSDREFLARLRKFEANADWAIDHESELLAHQGKNVAIDDCRIIGVSRSARTLRKRFAHLDTLYVTFVSPPDLVWIYNWDT
jgi:hypothetical protein